MSQVRDTMTSEVHRLLDVDDEEGFRSSELDGMDADAVREARYGDVLPFVDAKIEAERYSLLSMLLAGIYFGLVVGHFLFTTETWSGVGLWAVPVVLTSTYAVVTFINIAARLRRLSEARALLTVLATHPPAEREAAESETPSSPPDAA